MAAVVVTAVVVDDTVERQDSGASGQQAWRALSRAIVAGLATRQVCFATCANTSPGWYCVWQCALCFLSMTGRMATHSHSMSCQRRGGGVGVVAWLAEGGSSVDEGWRRCSVSLLAAPLSCCCSMSRKLGRSVSCCLSRLFSLTGMILYMPLCVVLRGDSCIHFFMVVLEKLCASFECHGSGFQGISS